VFWRWTSPIAIILSALLKGADSAAPSEAQRRPVPVLGGVLGAMAIAVLMTLLATVGHDWLPPLFLDSTNAVFSRLAFMKCITVTLTIAAMVLVFRQTRSVLDMWLLVTMFGWMVQAALNISLRERFTLGFYHFYGLTLFSNVIIMLALVVESSRLYARLALSVAATDRERDARLMSMDTLTAAIAHEVGQPLTAVTLNAMGGIKWLSRSPPNSAKAIQSLQATLEAARRTSDVIKSVRATSSRGAGTISEFNVNDLVRETAGLLGRELAAQNISLLLALDESLPPIRANRVQIQRVIINLLSNAIDALTVTRRRVRCISIRSALFEGQGVQLDVSDSGVGIEPRDMARIFEPFFTTKSKGTGLGLSLSRTIIEDHGGRLWASASDDSSATLHLQLPGFPSPTG
jgi:signal transduction histidine kinase